MCGWFALQWFHGINVCDINIIFLYIFASLFTSFWLTLFKTFIPFVFCKLVSQFGTQNFNTWNLINGDAFCWHYSCIWSVFGWIIQIICSNSPFTIQEVLDSFSWNSIFTSFHAVILVCKTKPDQWIHLCIFNIGQIQIPDIDNLNLVCNSIFKCFDCCWTHCLAECFFSFWNLLIATWTALDSMIINDGMFLLQWHHHCWINHSIYERLWILFEFCEVHFFLQWYEIKTIEPLLKHIHVDQIKSSWWSMNAIAVNNPLILAGIQRGLLHCPVFLKRMLSEFWYCLQCDWRWLLHSSNLHQYIAFVQLKLHHHHSQVQVQFLQVNQGTLWCFFVCLVVSWVLKK